MSRRLPPPNSPNPLDPAVAAMVKKKMAAPAGPPPSGLKDFKAPKNYGGISGGGGVRGSGYGYVDDDDEDDGDEDFDYTHIKQKPDTKHYAEESSDEDMSEDGRKRGDYSDSEEGSDYPSYRDDNRGAPRGGVKQRQADAKPSRRSAPQNAKQHRQRNYDEDDDYEDGDEYSGRRGGAKAHTPPRQAARDYKMNESERQQQQQGRVSESGKEKLALFKFNSILHATYRELKTFVTTPCEPGTVVRCYIERNRSGTNRLAPRYSLCADLENGTGREIMSCKKVFKSMSPHYVFSLKAEDLTMKREQRSKLFLGKLRGVGSNEFVLFDDGMYEAPEDRIDDGDDEDSDTENYTEEKRDFSQTPHYRKQLASIIYNAKKRPVSNGVRGMEVCIPNVDAEGTTARPVLKPPSDLNKYFKRVQLAGAQNEMLGKRLFILHEKASRYDALSSCLVDFRGRANIASVKNFQLIPSKPSMVRQSADTSGEIYGTEVNTDPFEADGMFMLQMGKTADDCFNMDFRSPLNMLQAFAICMSRFDANVSW